jgi:formate dehydrogenase major subunit
MGLDWNYWRADDGTGHEGREAPVARVYEEMRGVMTPLAGVPWSRLAREEAVVTPAPREDAPGESVVFIDHFPTADGRATLVPTHFAPSPEKVSAEYPFVLATGRMLEHWHTGAMTRRASSLDALAPEPLFNLHPADAAKLGVRTGERIRVTSHHGEIAAMVDVADSVQPGQVFIPFAFWEAAANKLTGSALDPFGKIPGFKVTAVRVSADRRDLG